ncbi:hypothetical protein V5O48_016743 [Marasmius crinis-equi]|uniref:Uncharacterized protein n=1 Tax=Marasmius crinis-equi TaxID=585013 RepID=A0ABR3EQX9_9AGAR
MSNNLTHHYRPMNKTQRRMPVMTRLGSQTTAPPTHSYGQRFMIWPLSTFDEQLRRDTIASAPFAALSPSSPACSPSPAPAASLPSAIMPPAPLICSPRLPTSSSPSPSPTKLITPEKPESNSAKCEEGQASKTKSGTLPNKTGNLPSKLPELDPTLHVTSQMLADSDADDDPIPILPSYLQHGSTHIDHTNYATKVKKAKFPNNFLLYLQTVPKDKQSRPEEFKMTVLKWLNLEGIWKSLDIPQQNLDKGQWPDIFSTWFKEGRTRMLRTPKNISAVKIKENWWTWWTAVNPSWRPQIDWQMGKGSDGGWDKLMSAGSKGIVLPLVALRWWYNVLEDGTNNAAWRIVLKDYYYALCWLYDASMTLTADAVKLS